MSQDRIIYAFFLFDYREQIIAKEAYDLENIPVLFSGSFGSSFIWSKNHMKKSLKEVALDLVQNLPDHEGDWSIVFSRTFQDYVGHIYHSNQQQGLIAISHRQYPVTDIHLFFKEILPVLQEQQQLNQSLVTWNQTPHSGAKVHAIDEDLEEIKKLMEENIEKVLIREECLEELLNKSEQISQSSRIFLKKSKKLNRCCLVL